MALDSIARLWLNSGPSIVWESGDMPGATIVPRAAGCLPLCFSGWRDCEGGPGDEAPAGVAGKSADVLDVGSNCAEDSWGVLNASGRMVPCPDRFTRGFSNLLLPGSEKELVIPVISSHRISDRHCGIRYQFDTWSNDTRKQNPPPPEGDLTTGGFQFRTRKTDHWSQKL